MLGRVLPVCSFERFEPCLWKPHVILSNGANMIVAGSACFKPGVPAAGTILVDWALLVKAIQWPP